MQNSDNLIVVIPNRTFLVCFVAYQVSLLQPELIFCQDIAKPKPNEPDMLSSIPERYNSVFTIPKFSQVSIIS